MTQDDTFINAALSHHKKHIKNSKLEQASDYSVDTSFFSNEQNNTDDFSSESLDLENNIIINAHKSNNNINIIQTDNFSSVSIYLENKDINLHKSNKEIKAHKLNIKSNNNINIIQIDSFSSEDIDLENKEINQGYDFNDLLFS